MRKPTATRRRRGQGPAPGFALLLVLWVTALLSVVAGTFIFSMRVEVASATNLLDRARAGALADAGVQRGILALLAADDEARWRTDGRPYRFPFAGGTVGVSIMSETGKIDLNTAPENLIRGLVAYVTADTGIESDSLTDAILDWRDGDRKRRAFGAEDGDYAAAGFLYGARDEDFMTRMELTQVMGFTNTLYERLHPLVTVYSRQPRVDPAFASREVLLSVPGLEPELVERYLAAREDGAGDALPYLGAEEFLGAAKSQVYTITAEGMLSGGARAVREAVIKFNPGRRGTYTLLAWSGPGSSAAGSRDAETDRQD